MKRQEKIEALVAIRDYMRENVELIPEDICNKFNLIAKAIGVEYPEGWCLFGIKALKTPDNRKHEGVVCFECGGPITETEYSYGASGCCGAGVVPEEDFGKIDGFTNR